MQVTSDQLIQPLTVPLKPAHKDRALAELAATQRFAETILAMFPYEIPAPDARWQHVFVGQRVLECRVVVQFPQ